MVLKLFNTLGRKKQEFIPIKGNNVGMYSCGPTVYWYQHIGNLRSYIFADILKRVLLYNGYKINHIMNVTDVGHLTGDADDSGEDKMEKAALKTFTFKPFPPVRPPPGPPKQFEFCQPPPPPPPPATITRFDKPMPPILISLAPPPPPAIVALL